MNESLTPRRRHGPIHPRTGVSNPGQIWPAHPPTSVIQTMLMHDGYFVGHKLRYDKSRAILWAASDAIEFYDEQGKLLRTIGMERSRKRGGSLTRQNEAA